MVKKTDFEKRLLVIEQEAMDFLKKVIKKGTSIRLYTEKEAEENDNIIYDLPNATYVSRHSMFDEYAIAGLKNEDGEIVVELEGKGDETGTEKSVKLSDIGSYYQIDGYNLCKLADEISKLLK